VFEVSFENWPDDANGRELAHHVRVSLQELKLKGTISGPLHAFRLITGGP
jgi:hypothetical protein